MHNIIWKHICNNVFFLFCLGLYFNKKIDYSKIKKKWITIHSDEMTWNHKFAELKHVIDNIELKKKHFDKPPKYIYYEKKLEDLNGCEYTKYEKFTSEIINKFVLPNKNIQQVKLLHVKNTRNGKNIDVPLMSLQMIDLKAPRSIYKLSESTKLTNVLSLFSNINDRTAVVCFTDWRSLYRSGYSLSHAKFFFLNDSVQKIVNKLHISIFSIVITSDKMYAIDMVNTES
jgi:hypothetical protein